MLAINFTPFPELKSKRLFFRQLNNNDAKDVFRLRSNPKQMLYIPRPILTEIAEAEAMITMMNEKIKLNTDINWAVCEQGTGKFIGFMGFYRTEPENYRTEIGYMILPEFEGKGYVTEAVHTMLNFAFNVVNIHSIVAVIDPENKASERILIKNKFSKEAHFRENEYFNGKFWDSVHYCILKEKFLNKK